MTLQKLGISSETVTLLEHMILSHHGIPEYGAAVRPMFLEAEILSTLDSLDATILNLIQRQARLSRANFQTGNGCLTTERYLTTVLRRATTRLI